MRLPIRSSPLTVDLRRPQGMPDVTHRWEVRHLVRDSVLRELGLLPQRERVTPQPEDSSSTFQCTPSPRRR